MSAPVPPGRGAHGRTLSDRDLEVLRLLARFRLLTGAQLQQLVVADGSPGTRARRCRALLQRLTERRLVQRLDRRIGGVRAGSDGYLYRLSSRGYGLLAVHDGSPRRRVQGHPGSRYIDHVLAVGQLSIDLVVACRETSGYGQPARVVRYDPEPACWRRYPAGHGRIVTLKPDAFVHTETGGAGLVHFVEIDRATESQPTIRAKCRAYADYWRSGQEQQRLGAFPRVLWVVPGWQRAALIRATLARLPADSRPLFAVTTSQQAAAVLLGRDALTPDSTTNPAPAEKGDTL